MPFQPKPKQAPKQSVNDQIKFIRAIHAGFGGNPLEIPFVEEN